MPRKQIVEAYQYKNILANKLTSARSLFFVKYVSDSSNGKTSGCIKVRFCDLSQIISKSGENIRTLKEIWTMRYIIKLAIDCSSNK